MIGSVVSKGWPPMAPEQHGAGAYSGQRGHCSVSDCRSEACLRKGCRGLNGAHTSVTCTGWTDGTRREDGLRQHTLPGLSLYSPQLREKEKVSESFAAKKTKNTYLILKCLSGFWVN